MYEIQTEEIWEQKSLFDFDINDDAEIEIEEIIVTKSLFDDESELGATKMQTLGLGDLPESKKPKGFWRRQFQQEPTKSQYKFDWIFGVVMPAICIFFDPFIFSTSAGEPLLGAYKSFAYVLSFTGIIAMMAWLIWGDLLKGLNALIAGLFLVSGLVALTIGTVMLPFSLFGLIFLIGILGFTPLFTGIVYLRNAVRAIRAVEPVFAERTLAYSILLSSLASGIIPYVINVDINRSLERIKTGNAKTIRAEGLKLWLVSPIVDTSSLVSRHRFESRNKTETDETKAIADVYRDLTGKDISTVSTIGLLEY